MPRKVPGLVGAYALLATFRRLPRGALLLGTLLLILIALLWLEESRGVAWDGLGTWAGIVTVILLLVALHLRVPSRLREGRQRQIAAPRRDQCARGYRERTGRLPLDGHGDADRLYP